MFIIFLLYFVNAVRLRQRILQDQQELVSQQIQIGQEYNDQGIVESNSRSVLQPVNFYYFRIEEVQQEKDLFIILRSVQDKSTFPTLYLSRTNQRPSEGDELCGTDGLDVCSISPEKIELNATYYLGVYCLTDCRYTLRVHFQQEEILEVGTDAIMAFQNTDENLFKIHLSTETEDRLIIRAHFLQGNEFYNGTFHMYINEGNENPSTIKYDYKADEIWSVGKGVVITKNDTNLQLNSNLTVLLSCKENTRLYVQSMQFGHMRTIRLTDIISDLVGPNQVNYYHLQIEPAYVEVLDRNSLAIDIHPYEGNPDMYISTAPRPAQLDDYYWKSTLDLGYESINISPKHRDAKSSPDTEFYIAIKGSKEFASYSFAAYAGNYQNSGIMLLSTESGFLTEGEVAQYQVWIEDKNKNNTFTLETSIQGDGFIILKKCMKNATEMSEQADLVKYVKNAEPNNYYNCSITDKDIQSAKNQTHIIQDNIEIHSSQHTIQFEFNQFECYNQVATVPNEWYASNCIYIFGVVAESILTYSIEMKDKKVHKELVENVAYRAYLMQYDQNNYVFHNQDPTIKSILIQITVQNGDIIAYASRTDQYPNATNNEASMNMELDVMKFNQKDLIGSYYIQVTAQSLSKYLILITAEREDGQSSTSIRLLPSESQRISLQSPAQQYYFHLQIDFTDPDPIFLHLSSIQGSFIAYVKVSTEPSREDHDFILRSSSHTLVIQNGDNRYQPRATYKILVVSLSTQPNEIFEIWYTTTMSQTALKYGIPSRSTLDDGQQAYFYFEAPFALDDVLLIQTMNTEQTKQDDLTIVIIYQIQYLSRRIRYPNYQKFEQKLNGTWANISNFGQGDILYIGVTSKGYNEFTLLIKGRSSISQLIDSQPQQIIVSKDYQEAQLYYQIRSLSSIQIQTHTSFAEIVTFASFIDSHQQINRDLFPTSTNYTLKNSQTNTLSTSLLFINQSTIKESCPNGCILLITLKLNDTLQENDTILTITLSHQISTIKNGDVLIGQALDGIMTYYKFTVPYPIDIIEVQVSPIGDGDPDLYVLKQKADDEAYPALDKYDYRSIKFKADLVKILQTDFTDQNNSGDYIIGVNGFMSDVTFSISLTWADVEVIPLLENQRYTVTSQSERQYFRYEHSKFRSLRLIVDGISHLSIGITTMKGRTSGSESLIQSLPYYSNASILFTLNQSDGLFGGLLHISNSDPSFCARCTYLFAVNTTVALTFSLLVAVDNQPLVLEPGYNYLDSVVNSSNQYLINSQTQHKHLIIKTYTGNYTLLMKNDKKPSNTNYDQQVTFTENMDITVINQQQYLMIYGTAQYQISYQEEYHTNSLQIGKQFSSIIQTEAIFQVHPLLGLNIYTVQLDCHNCSILFKYNSKQNLDFKVLAPIENNQGLDQIYQTYQIQYQDNSQYQLMITSPSQQTFSILLSVKGLKYIDANQLLQENVQLHDIQKYEIFGRKGQQLYLELSNCIGLSGIVNGSIQDQLFNFTDDGDVFFEIYTYETQTQTVNHASQYHAIYRLIPHLTYNLPKWIKPEIPLTIEKINNSIVVNVTKLKAFNNRTDNLTFMTYQVHLSSTKQELVAYAACNMDIELLRQYQVFTVNSTKLYHKKYTMNLSPGDQSEGFQVKFDLPKDKFKELFIIVQMQAFYMGEQQPYSYLYEPLNITLQNATNTTETEEIPQEQQSDLLNTALKFANDNYEIVIGIASAIVIAVMGITLRCCVLKYRQMKARKPVQKNVDEDEEKESCQ